MIIRILTAIVFCMLIATSMLHAASTTTMPNIMILWPDSTANPVNPRLVYQCNDIHCSTMSKATQLEYVTAVPVQSSYGVQSPAPAPISFIAPPSGATTYKIYVSDQTPVTTKSTWKSCTLAIDSSGNLDTSHTDCSGAVKTANSSSTVSSFAFGAPPFASTPDTPPTGYKTYNDVPTRTITFKNSTSTDVCLNLASKFNQDNCTGTGDNIIAASGGILTINVSGSSAPSGQGGAAMSQAAFVSGYKDKSGKWIYSGNNNSLGGVYATAMEWSLFPTVKTGKAVLPTGTTDHSLGMSDVDVSVVNGFNFGVSLSTTSPAVCGSAVLQNGQVQPTSYSVYTGAISKFPNKTSKFESMCPSTAVFNHTTATQVVRDTNHNFLGCLSPCKYALEVQTKAGLSTQQVNAICCAAGTVYDDSVKCTNTSIPWGNTATGGFKMIKHDQLPYVTDIKANSTNVYTWQFDDDNGNFSCQPDASFTFEITTR